MHGKRKKDVKPLTEEERQKNEEQGEKIISLINDFLEIRHGLKPVSNPAEYCDIIANMCPDLPTIYNYKREVVMKTFGETQNPKDKYKLLMNELQLVTGLLKRSPKSYSLWSYRQWLVLECRQLERLYHKLKAAKEAQIKQQQLLLKQEKNNDSESNKEGAQQKNANEPEEQIPQVVELELKLCNKMLDMDERNFHCWNYRNWLINDVEKNSLPYVEREIAYTQQKYENNFSNFSALHFRSKNLVKKYDEELLTLSQTGVAAADSQSEEELKKVQGRILELVQFKIPLQLIKDELELIKNAIFIQPNEQGVWLYHKWIVSLLVPFRFVSVKSLNGEQSSVRITSSSKMNSSNIKEVIYLYDKNGAIIKEFSIDEVRNQIGQIFTVTTHNNSTSIAKVIMRQSTLCNSQVVDYQMAKRNLISSEFIYDPNTSTFVLQKNNQSDEEFNQIAYSIIEEESQFVQEVIENEKQSKFALFHKLYLLQVKQSLDLVFKTNDYSLSIQSSQSILEVIEQLNSLAKKQTFYLKNLSSQYHTLLSLQQTLLKSVNKGESVDKFELPSSPTYEEDLLLPYFSLLSH